MADKSALLNEAESQISKYNIFKPKAIIAEQTKYTHS